jgi:hypothetical protein
MGQYLAQSPIQPFDDSDAVARIEQRNAIRSATRLPLLNIEQEIGRLRAHYEVESRSDRFHSLASAVIDEIYGPITPDHFHSLSELRGFMAHKHNLMRDLMRKQTGQR